MELKKYEEEIINKIEIYTCPNCKKSFPNIANSAPPMDGELCVQCYCEMGGLNN